MKAVTIILKGFLLSFTILYSLIIGAGIDSLYERNYLIPALVIEFGLVYLCYALISKEDFERLTGGKDIDIDEDL